MSWISPNPRRAKAALKRLAGLRSADRHRTGYWRDYHARKYDERRPYLTAKAVEYRT